MLSTDVMTLILYLTALGSGVLAGSISPALAYSRSILLGITLMHSVLAGALVGVYLNYMTTLPLTPPLMAVIFAVTASIIAAEAVNRGVSEDTAISAVVSVYVSITLLFTYLVATTVPLGVSKAMGYVFGMSSIVTVSDLARVFISLVIVMPFAHLFWYEYKFISFDPEGAEARGLSVRFYRYLYYTLASIAATTLAMTLGVLLTHIIMVVPGLFALRGRHTYPYRISYLIGTTVVFLGYLIATPLALPPSAGVGIVSAISILYLVLVRRGD